MKNAPQSVFDQDMQADKTRNRHTMEYFVNRYL